MEFPIVDLTVQDLVRTESLAGVSYDVLSALCQYLLKINTGALEDGVKVQDGTIVTILDEFGDPVRFSIDWDAEIGGYVVSGPELTHSYTDL